MARKVSLPFLSLAVILLVWGGGVAVTGGVGFAGPVEVFYSFTRFAVSGAFWGALLDTVVLSLVGLMLGLVIAVVIGVIFGSNDFLGRSAVPTLNFLRVMPSVVLIPLFLVSVGNSAAMVILLTAMVSSFKLVVFVIRGVAEATPRLNEGARILGVSPVTAAFVLRIPAAAEAIMTGLRLTIARAYGAVVVVGLTTSGPGIGGELMRAKTAVNVPDVFAYAVVAGLVGTGFFFMFSWLDRKVVFWRRAQ